MTRRRPRPRFPNEGSPSEDSPRTPLQRAPARRRPRRSLLARITAGLGTLALIPAGLGTLALVPAGLSTLALVLSAATACAQVPESRHLGIEPLADGVWAAIAADDGYAISNAGIIDLDGEALVYDAFISPEPADDLRRAAEALTGGSVRWGVLGHYHNDHIRGAQVFDGAEIISTEWTREAILEREPQTIAAEREQVPGALKRTRARHEAETDPERRRELGFWVAYYDGILRSLPMLETTPPRATFEGTFRLHRGGRTIELLDVGRGHTGSDVVLHLPDEGIAFTSDLLFVERHPYLASGHPDD